MGDGSGFKNSLVQISRLKRRERKGLRENTPEQVKTTEKQFTSKVTGGKRFRIFQRRDEVSVSGKIKTQS